MRAYLNAVRELEPGRRLGLVTRLNGLSIEACGPDAVIGELCALQRRAGGPALLAEVVALHPGRTVLLPYGSTEGLAAGAEVCALGRPPDVAVGSALLGRVVDAFGAPLDGLPPPLTWQRYPLRPAPRNPLERPPVSTVLETGIRCIDTLLTLGQGQRVGIFAGSGVGKSTLLGMITRHVRADVNVIAMIGERGREVRDFITRQLGDEGLRRSVVVVATADQPAPARLRASHAALAVAEYFRDTGRQVLLSFDSVTRFAMARRELGLAAGEPATARGYTPSVFTELPALCERCGPSLSGGSITALFSVLVEGDDFNEPVSDSLRACLDGHIVLTRALAHQGHYPAIDVLQSNSRLMRELAGATERAMAERVVRTLAELERNRQMIELGVYQAGSNAVLDAAIGLEPHINALVRQAEGGVPRAAALKQLAALENIA